MTVALQRLQWNTTYHSFYPNSGSMRITETYVINHQVSQVELQ